MHGFAELELSLRARAAGATAAASERVLRVGGGHELRRELHISRGDPHQGGVLRRVYLPPATKSL